MSSKIVRSPIGNRFPILSAMLILMLSGIWLLARTALDAIALLPHAVVHTAHPGQAFKTPENPVVHSTMVADEGGQFWIRSPLLKHSNKSHGHGNYLMEKNIHQIAVTSPAGVELVQPARGKTTSGGPGGAVGGASNAAAAGTLGLHHARGKIKSISTEGIVLSQAPIPALKWTAMTMMYKLPEGGVPRNLSVGEEVIFELLVTADGTYRLTKILSAESDKKGTGQ
jgi:Cu/Ag efflux protein CusF